MNQFSTDHTEDMHDPNYRLAYLERVNELYRQQIAFLRAELERAALSVAIHYTPAERIHALKTEWIVTSVNEQGPALNTMTDALALKAKWDEWQPDTRHHIRYRHTTPWRTISEAQ